MTVFIALLRAVNLAASTTLKMEELRAWAEAAGFERPRTYIASGNLLLESDLEEGEVKARLEAMLAKRAGRAIGVMVRSPDEMVAVGAANPFADKPGNRVMAIFLDDPPPQDFEAETSGAAGEEVRGGVREIYVHYPMGQAATKLKIPAAKAGTARNMNTVAKLAAMAAKE